MINLIVAHSKNLGIGIGNQLPWHISEDLKYFKKITQGHTIIMGRKTFESIGRPLPNRRNIVISLATENLEGVEIERDFIKLLEYYKSTEEEVFIIGGGKIYKESLPYADKLFITEIDIELDNADTFFPDYSSIIKNALKIEKDAWQLDEKTGLNFRFIQYVIHSN